MYRTIAKLATLATLTLSTAASAQSVSYDYDKDTDFSMLKTYAWVSGTNLRDELNHKRIMDAVDAQLVPPIMPSFFTSCPPRRTPAGGTGWGLEPRNDMRVRT